MRYIATPERPILNPVRSEAVNSSDRPAVLKFGGTSVESAERIRALGAIVAGRVRQRRTVVVVSALAGVTNDLVRAARLAAAADPEAERIIRELALRHTETARELASADELGVTLSLIESWRDDLRSLIHGVSLVRDCSPRVLDAIAVHGELLSATIVAAALRGAGIPAEMIDARRVIVTDDAFGNAVVDRALTDPRIREVLRDRAIVPVVTGFVAASADGSSTTLGRGGSDYTATLLGAALEAEVVEIWTDVDGVMSADPRLVPQAYSLPRLSYTELMELSHFGARVIYPPAVNPARDAGVPLVIRNTLNPAFPGTWVLPGSVADEPTVADVPPAMAVRGISSINRVALCRLEGAGMVGVPGIASRLFGALARDAINVILISQASSEHSICFAVDPATATRARRMIDGEFAVERRAGVVEPLVVEEEYAIVAAVGEGMRRTPGIAGRLFDVLGRNGINVRAIAQGSSELNISLVVSRADEARALRLIHDAFFLPRTRNVQVFVAGTGRVGAALLDQMGAEAAGLIERAGLRVIVSGIGRSRASVIDADGIPLGAWRAAADGAAEPGTGLVDAALASPNAHRVFVDCTASRAVADAYETLLRSGVAIVTANKIALSGSMGLYLRLRQAARRGNGMFAETTVGAGLPVLRPLADLVATGDAIDRIEGVLSGTVSFLFARLAAGDAFSACVREAFDRGFTEPDPREDLSGRDVARKLLILAREAGFELEPEQVEVEGLLPGDGWAELSLDAFWDRLPAVDAHYAERRRQALDAGRVLCYLGRVDEAGAGVMLTDVGPAHPCASLLPGDNLIAITSERYAERPLVIRGPGAGPDVTAAGVFADVIRAGLEAR